MNSVSTYDFISTFGRVLQVYRTRTTNHTVDAGWGGRIGYFSLLAA